MKVSRDYISSTEIQDFGDKSFIKLPIQGYLDLLDIEPIPPQIALINAINDPRHRFVVGMLSRRTGKTLISNILAQLVLLHPGSNVLVISPNYSLSEISWSEQKKLLNKFGIERTKENAKDKIIELQNGSVLRMASVSQADSAVGRSYDLILFDECALDDKGRDAFNVALRPTLDKANSKAIFISTPRGENFFYEFYQRGFSSEFSSWASIFSTWVDNPRAVPEDIEEAKRGMSRAEFEQEYLCSTAALEGRIYDLPDSNIIESYPSLASLDIIIGMDVGYRDATAITVMGVDIDSGDVFILDEYVDNCKNTSQIADALGALMDRWECDFCYIDSAAAQMRSDLAELYSIATYNAKKDVLAGIATVASLVDNGRVSVLAHCAHTIEMFKNYSWDRKEGLVRERPKHDMHSHIADAVRYALYSYSANIVV